MEVEGNVPDLVFNGFGQDKWAHAHVQWPQETTSAVSLGLGPEQKTRQSQGIIGAVQQVVNTMAFSIVISAVLMMLILAYQTDARNFKDFSSRNQ